MHPRSMRTAVAVLASLLVLAPATPAAAQYLTRPALKWETIETAHFRFHFPAEMRTWVVPVAERMESVSSSVNTMVGLSLIHI